MSWLNARWFNSNREIARGDSDWSPGHRPSVVLRKHCSFSILNDGPRILDPGSLIFLLGSWIKNHTSSGKSYLMDNFNFFFWRKSLSLPSFHHSHISHYPHFHVPGTTVCWARTNKTGFSTKLSQFLSTFLWFVWSIQFCQDPQQVLVENHWCWKEWGLNESEREW